MDMHTASCTLARYVNNVRYTKCALHHTKQMHGQNARCTPKIGMNSGSQQHKIGEEGVELREIEEMVDTRRRTDCSRVWQKKNYLGVLRSFCGGDLSSGNIQPV